MYPAELLHYLSYFFTVTLHFKVFPYTFALITVFPFFKPVTTPFVETLATAFLLVAHFTFAFPTPFTESFFVFPFFLNNSSQ